MSDGNGEVNSEDRRKRRWRIARRFIVLFALALGVAASVAWRVMLFMPGESHQGDVPELSGTQESLGDELRADVEMLANEIGERHVGNDVAQGVAGTAQTQVDWPSL